MSVRRPPSVPITLAEIARRLGLDAPEGGDVELTGVAPIEAAGPGDLTLYADGRRKESLAACRAGAIVVDADLRCEVSVPTLRVRNARLVFGKAVSMIHPPRRPAPGVHPTAVVPESCTLGRDVHIGPYVVLGEDVTLGDEVVLHPHVVVYEGAEIGARSMLHAHAIVRERVRIGTDALLQPGAIVGADGFGFALEDTGRWYRIQQVGTVVMGDWVDVGATACVDRASLGATTIGTGVKIDNHAQLGHNCTVGDETMLCGQVGLAGSTHVGRNTVLGAQVGVAGHLTIGDRVQVGAKGGVVNDLESGKAYVGIPVAERRTGVLMHGLLPRLPEVVRDVKALKKSVADLEARLGA